MKSCGNYTRFYKIISDEIKYVLKYIYKFCKKIFTIKKFTQVYISEVRKSMTNNRLWHPIFDTKKTSGQPARSQFFQFPETPFFSGKKNTTTYQHRINRQRQPSPMLFSCAWEHIRNIYSALRPFLHWLYLLYSYL